MKKQSRCRLLVLFVGITTLGATAHSFLCNVRPARSHIPSNLTNVNRSAPYPGCSPG